MKKIISAVMAASLAVASMGTVCASAAEKYGDGMDIVVFGDSIAEGYDLGAAEYNYGQIIADYFGGTVSNYAKAGDETTDTLSKIAGASDLADAEVVIISSGANDMIHYATKYMLQLCGRIDALADGYTVDNIPERPTFEEMMKMIDTTALKEFASSFTNQRQLNSEILKLSTHLTITTGTDNAEKYDRVIETQVIPNIEQMVKDIRAVNPNARIIVQTIYNPLQLEESYIDEKVPASYQQMLSLLTPTFNRVIEAYRTQVMAVEGVEIADVYTDFTSGSGYSWYFTGFQDANVKDFKVHPNQSGHLAIAANIINVLGETREDGGLLNLTYEKLSNKDSYPAAALAEYNKVAGTYVLGNLNGDAILDASDASIILSAYAELSTGTASSLTETESKAADVDGNGLIDSSDASAILAYYSYCSTGGTASLKNFNAGN